MEDGFPLLTLKRMAWHQLFAEFEWFLAGGRNIKELNEKGIHYWDSYADESGDLGPIYGAQWSKYQQVKRLIETLKTNPNHRRHLIVNWNEEDLPEMSLPPCVMLYQFYVQNHRLSVHVYQRSADVFLGLPFDIAQTALLLHYIAKETGLIPETIYYTIGDAHIYEEHYGACNIMLKRAEYPLPQLEIHRHPHGYVYELKNYKSHGVLKRELKP